MSFYGDTQRWWVGTVEEGSGQTDPTALGRTRVRIDGIHGPGIFLNDLPYAQTILPCTGGGTSSFGENPQLLPGARVTGFFLDGAASQIPCIYGYMPHIAIPTITQSQIIDEAKTVIVRNNSTDVEPETEIVDGVISESRADIKTRVGGKGSGVSVSQTEFVNAATYSTRATIDFDNVSKIWYWFEDRGVYRDYHIAGIIGNLIHESGSNRNLTISTTVISAVEGEFSQGIAQWNPASGGEGGRLGDLQDYARDNGTVYTDLYTQVAFIDHELHTHTYLNEGFFDTLNTEQATAHFTRNYLRPTWCRTGRSNQKSDTRLNDTSVEKPDGTFVTDTCVPFEHPVGNTKSIRYPGGNFPSGQGFIRAGEEERLKVANRILTKYTQGTP